MMELGERQILRSALYQHGHYDYPLPKEGWHVYLFVPTVSDNGYWARWVLEHKASPSEIFERSRRRKFSKREDAIDWLYSNPDEPWTDAGQELILSGPIPRPSYRRANPAE